MCWAIQQGYMIYKKQFIILHTNIHYTQTHKHDKYTNDDKNTDTHAN